MRAGVVASFADCLPEQAVSHPVTLGEGDTPLLRLRHLPARHGVDAEIWCKFEGANPTGSFKDRGMAVAVSAAAARGARTVICASTGNTSASAAAYAAAAGLDCAVLLPAGKVAAGKLAQAFVHGARVLEVRGNFDAAMQAVQSIDDDSVEIVNSINPMRIQGQKTIAFEIVAALGRAPDIHALPVGNAGNITAHWIGYSEAAGRTTAACRHCGDQCRFPQAASPQGRLGRPRMLGVQAAGAAPFISGAFVDNPETVATAIRIGAPQSWDQAHAAVKESDGRVVAVADSELLAAQRELASLEGIFCEPASAASVAGVLAQAAAGQIAAGSTVVCTLTGHGLKDPAAIEIPATIETIDSDPAALGAALGLQRG